MVSYKIGDRRLTLRLRIFDAGLIWLGKALSGRSSRSSSSRRWHTTVDAETGQDVWKSKVGDINIGETTTPRGTPAFSASSLPSRHGSGTHKFWTRLTPIEDQLLLAGPIMWIPAGLIYASAAWRWRGCGSAAARNRTATAYASNGAPSSRSRQDGFRGIADG